MIRLRMILKTLSSRRPINSRTLGRLSLAQTQVNTIHLVEQEDKDRDDQVPKTKITMETSKTKMIFISITQDLEQEMPITFGKKREANIHRIQISTIAATSTKPVQTQVQRQKKRLIEQMLPETLKKKLSGGVATPKRRKISTKRISMEICSGLRMVNTPKRGGKAIQRQTLRILSSLIHIRYSTNSSLAKKLRRKKRHMTSILRERSPILIRKTGDLMQGLTIFRGTLGHQLFGLEY
jgi:hypothetical protein